MTEPITTLTATAIATLAFQKFIEGGAGKLAEKFTQGALQKMDELRKKIWDKLRGKKNAEAAMTAIEKGSGENISQELNRLAVYLQDVMDDDPEFKAELEVIAREINAGKLQDRSQMIQKNYDSSTGYQIKQEGHYAAGHPLLLKLAAGILHAEEGEIVDITAWRADIFEILGLHHNDPEASISKILDASISRLRPELQVFLGRLSVYLLPFDRQAAGLMWENLTPNSSAIAPRIPEGDITDLEQEQDLRIDKLNTVIATQVSEAFPQGNSNPKSLEVGSESVILIEKELRKLAKRCLLQERKQEGTWIFQFQPLIQEYLHQKTSDEEKKIAHQQAIIYYEQRRKPQLESTDELDAVKEYLQIFYHNCEIGQYLPAFNIIQQQTNPDDRYSGCDSLLQLRGYNAIRLNLYELLLAQWRPETDEEVIPFIDTVKTYGDVLQFLDRREEALNHYQQALEYYRQIGDRLGEANILQEFGKLESNPQQALEYLQQAQTLYVQISHIYSQSRNLLFIADAQLNLGEKDAAISSLTQASELAASINYQPFQEYAANKIAEIQNPAKPNLWSSVRRFFQQRWVIYGLLFLIGLIVVLLLR